FKLWFVSKVVKGLIILLGLALLGFVCYYLWYCWGAHIAIITVKDIAWLAILFIIGLISKLVMNILNYKIYIRNKLLLIAIAILGFFICWMYVAVLNPMYNRIGRMNK